MCLLASTFAAGCTTQRAARETAQAQSVYDFDDEPYVPQGPEVRLARQIEALEAYKRAQREAALRESEAELPTD